MGDALAICLMERRGFQVSDFAKLHPGGTLGKKLYLRVSDLYLDNEKPQVYEEQSLKEVIVEMTRKRLGVTAVISHSEKLLGIITDGDLRRMLEKDVRLDTVLAKDIMTPHPKTIEGDELAVNALDIMRRNEITQLVVTGGTQYLGMIHLHDLIKEGLI
jgi:arabinose-5-phosphate isomerase